MEPRELEIGNREHETAATVALLRSGVVSPPHRLSPFLEELGSAVKLVQLSEEDRMFAPDSPTHDFIGAVVADDIDSALSEVRRWTRRGLDFRTVLDADYPPSLLTIFNNPPLLFVEGQWKEEIDSLSVAVVGTRSASKEGIARARRVSRELVEAGFTVVSGMADGIDTAAHEAALEAHGRTVAVMGTGIDDRYPAANAELAESILSSGGALLSQFFPEQGPRRWTFPQRNVTMSGLTLATVVVEAAATSGARMQARVALQHGRTVFLPRSLIESHDWARTYVDDGVYDTHAIPVETTDDIVSRLHHPTAEPLVAVP
jgi:DNA processing protein